MPKGKGRKGLWVKEWREFGRSLYDKIRGQKHAVVSSGDVVVLGPEGRKHMLGQGQTPEGIKAIPYLPELIQKAFKTGEYNPKPSEAKTPNPRPATIYHSAAVIDGKLYDVQLVAKRNAVGEQELMFYDLRARGKTTDGPTEPQLPKGNNPHEPPQVGSPSVGNNISSTWGGVNADLTSTRVADFFGDVKDIVDDITPGGVSGGGKAVDTTQYGKMAFGEITLSSEQKDAWKILSDKRVGEPLDVAQSVAARNLWASSSG